MTVKEAFFFSNEIFFFNSFAQVKLTKWRRDEDITHRSTHHLLD